MATVGKAERIELRRFDTPQMRAFHMTWIAFFLSFFAWFSVAPLMPVLRHELGLSKQQVGNSMIAAVAITIFARVLIGWLCDRIGPRKAYAGLLVLSSVPMVALALASSYTGFLWARLMLGAIGASFVITSYHTSVMFAPNVVGTASATAAGWGNLGGGATQLVMPLLMSGFVALGFAQSVSWRMALLVPAALLPLAGIAYYRLTQDTPAGNFSSLPDRDKNAGKGLSGLAEAARDPRVWALSAMYAGSFGVELTTFNVASLYFTDYFGVGLTMAGLLAGLHGFTNVFARTLGGLAGDRAGMRWGMSARMQLLGGLLLTQGVCLVAFSRMTALGPACVWFVLFSVLVAMSAGATFSAVPFVNSRALGAVAGLVGAGGNIGAVLAGFLFRDNGIKMPTAMLYMGVSVIAISGTALVVRFHRETATSSEPETWLPGQREEAPAE